MEHTGTLAEVIVDLNARRTDRVFHYAVPVEYADGITVGSRVLVPFGSRRLPGYVVGFGLTGESVQIKNIIGILDSEPVFTPELLELARWMADNYLCSTAEALQRILSPRLSAKKSRGTRLLRPALPADRLGEILDAMGRSPAQLAVMQKAIQQPGLTRKELAAAAEVSTTTVDTLVEKGYLEVTIKESSLWPDRVVGHNCPEIHILNPEQEASLNQIKKAIAQGSFKAFLLQGVTGSGKTEVYLRAIAATLQAGRQALALVPEISLTPQMVDLFRSRFGGQVAVLHSALSGGERYGEWRRVNEGEAVVVLGTRSAVFAPLKKPGLLILDEEHEPSYKQEDHLRYHAREVALKRAQLSGGVVVLGSATPSLESQCRAKAGGPYQLLQLTHRVDQRPLPPVRIVDMRQELKEGNRGIFSRPLSLAVSKRLVKGEQSILFLNRRGYATFVVCRECGLVLKCPQCDISLTYHQDGRLRCHYCNHSAVLPETCPDCGSCYIRHFGTGTQRVEEETQKLFPGARLLRMDSDSTSRKGSHQKIIDNFRDGQADILIGTQMVAKGLDLPGVTLVGVINADTTLHMPDFRAAERTFQLLTQVAGRAGRGGLSGEVLVQTYCPEHYSITAAAAHDCDRFYNNEMPIRRLLGYPPFCHLARLLFTHEDENEVKAGALQAKEFIDAALSSLEGANIEILGPAPSPMSRIKNRYRWQLVLKAPRRNLLKEVIKKCVVSMEKNRPSNKSVINVDINPQGMF